MLLRLECHRPCDQILESKTSPSTCSTSMAIVSYMAERPQTPTHCSCTQNETAQCVTTISTGIVFTKYLSVMDSLLCNHKDMATRWADGEQPSCICSTLQTHLHHPQPEGQHFVLDGDTRIHRRSNHIHRYGIPSNQDFST